MNREDLERMYLVEHLTMQQIGEAFGVTRQNVFHHIKKFQIDGNTAERFNINCDLCGKEYTTTRKRYITSIKHYCTQACYTASMHNPEYKQHRNGQRVARSVLEKELGKVFLYGETVHHIDGNNDNNAIENLMIFKSQSEHIAYHHKKRQERKS